MDNVLPSPAGDDAGPQPSRRAFARGVLLGLPAALGIEQFRTSSPADAATAPNWRLGGNAVTASARLGTTTAHPLAIETAGAERIWVATSGRVGVGTTAPSAALHVASRTGRPTVLVEQTDSGDADGLTVTSATTTGGNALGARLTAQYPGEEAAAVFGYVNSGFDTAGTGVWGGHAGSGRGVYGEVADNGVGVAGKTFAYNGLAGLFENPNLAADGTPGTSVRAYAAGGNYANLHPGGQHPNAAGEFAGAVGVLGAAAGEHQDSCGVLGLGPNANGSGVQGVAGVADSAAVLGYHPGPGAALLGVNTGDGAGVEGSGVQTAAVGGTFFNRAVTPGAGVHGYSGHGTSASIRNAVAEAAHNSAGLETPYVAGYGGGEFVGRYGVVAVADHALPGGAGVLGVGETGGTGILGYGTIGMSGTGSVTGVGAFTRGNDGVALFAGGGGGAIGISCSGDAHVFGTLTKGGGSFRIDHPLDPANKFLSHSFVESPEMLNVYSGTATLNEAGTATVELPDWFEALNRDHRYQLTCIGAFAPVYVAERVHHGRFAIAGGSAGLEVCWQITGVRQDAWARAYSIPVEHDKDPSDRGRYLYPELIGPQAQHLRIVSDRLTAEQEREAQPSIRS